MLRESRTHLQQRDYFFGMMVSRIATENLGAIRSFSNFLITRESYAVVYVPTLAEAILKAEQAGN